VLPVPSVTTSEADSAAQLSSPSAFSGSGQEHSGPVQRSPTLPRQAERLISASSVNHGGAAGAINWYRKFEYGRGAGLLPNSKAFAPWFFGVCSREQAESTLMDKPDDAFLVRISESRLCFVISLRGDDRVRHYMVEQNRFGEYGLLGGEEQSGMRTLKEPLHATLQALIDCFSRHRINASQRLGQPCLRPRHLSLKELMADSRQAEEPAPRVALDRSAVNANSNV
jgi:hypothetical protein